MKPTTDIWGKFESKGKPDKTQIVNGTVREVLMAHAKWLLDVYMGTHIQITYARTREELVLHSARTKSDTPDSDMMAELAAMMDQDQLFEGTE